MGVDRDGVYVAGTTTLDREWFCRSNGFLMLDVKDYFSPAKYLHICYSYKYKSMINLVL